MSINVRKGKHYTNLNHDWLTKGWNISAASFHRLMQCLYNKDAMNEWGSIVALSYMAAQRVFPDYNDMADNKAYLESVARSFGYFFGKEKKVRVNTISQSPTPTTAGKGVKGFDGLWNTQKKCLHLVMQQQRSAPIILFLYFQILQKKLLYKIYFMTVVLVMLV